MKQQRSWCPFLRHKLIAVLISMVVLAAILIGFLTGGNSTVVFFFSPRLFSLAMHCFSIAIVLGSLPVFIVSFRSIKHIHIPVALIHFKRKSPHSEIRLMQTMMKAAFFLKKRSM